MLKSNTEMTTLNSRDIADQDRRDLPKQKHEHENKEQHQCCSRYGDYEDKITNRTNTSLVVSPPPQLSNDFYYQEDNFLLPADSPVSLASPLSSSSSLLSLCEKAKTENDVTTSAQTKTITLALASTSTLTSTQKKLPSSSSSTSLFSTISYKFSLFTYDTKEIGSPSKCSCSRRSYFQYRRLSPFRLFTVVKYTILNFISSWCYPKIKRDEITTTNDGKHTTTTSITGQASNTVYLVFKSLIVKRLLLIPFLFLITSFIYTYCFRIQYTQHLPLVMELFLEAEYQPIAFPWVDSNGKKWKQKKVDRRKKVLSPKSNTQNEDRFEMSKVTTPPRLFLSSKNRKKNSNADRQWIQVVQAASNAYGKIVDGRQEDRKRKVIPETVRERRSRQYSRYQQQQLGGLEALGGREEEQHEQQPLLMEEPCTASTFFLKLTSEQLQYIDLDIFDQQLLGTLVIRIAGFDMNKLNRNNFYNRDLYVDYLNFRAEMIDTLTRKEQIKLLTQDTSTSQDATAQNDNKSFCPRIDKNNKNPNQRSKMCFPSIYKPFMILEEIFKGAHIVIEKDGGIFYNWFKEMQDSYLRQSSHYSMSPMYGLPEGSVLRTMLTGRNKNGDTWFQFEGANWAPLSRPRESLIHAFNFVQYVVENKQVGPLGESIFVDRTPLKINFDDCYKNPFDWRSEFG